MKKLVNKIFNLGTERNREMIVVPARHLYILACDDAAYISFDNDDEMIDLRDFQYIDLHGVNVIYLTNPVGSGNLHLLFSNLLKMELRA